MRKRGRPPKPAHERAREERLKKQSDGLSGAALAAKRTAMFVEESEALQAVPEVAQNRKAVFTAGFYLRQSLDALGIQCVVTDDEHGAFAKTATFSGYLTNASDAADRERFLSALTRGAR